MLIFYGTYGTVPTKGGNSSIKGLKISVSSGDLGISNSVRKYQHMYYFGIFQYKRKCSVGMFKYNGIACISSSSDTRGWWDVRKSSS
jgi:hypothetical protein